MNPLNPCGLPEHLIGATIMTPGDGIRELIKRESVEKRGDRVKMPFQRNQFSVVDVAMTLAGDVTGSGQCMTRDETRQMVAWLKWRVEEGWAVHNGTFAELDYRVRDLARTVVRMCDERLLGDHK